MAFNMKLQVASVLIVAVMFALYSAHGVSCQDGESSAEKKPLEAVTAAGPAAAAAKKNPLGGLPVIVVRQSSSSSSSGGSSSSSSSSSSSKPDIYLGWLNWEGLSFIKPFAGPFLQQVQPFSQEMSGMLLNTLPGASSIYSQFDQIGNQFSQLNPFSQLVAQFGGSSGSGSSSGSSSLPGLGGLSSIFQGFQGR